MVNMTEMKTIINYIGNYYCRIDWLSHISAFIDTFIINCHEFREHRIKFKDQLYEGYS